MALCSCCHSTPAMWVPLPPYFNKHRYHDSGQPHVTKHGELLSSTECWVSRGDQTWKQIIMTCVISPGPRRRHVLFQAWITFPLCSVLRIDNSSLLLLLNISFLSFRLQQIPSGNHLIFLFEYLAMLVCNWYIAYFSIMQNKTAWVLGLIAIQLLCITLFIYSACSLAVEQSWKSLGYISEEKESSGNK